MLTEFSRSSNDSTPNTRRKALVLGEKAVAQTIAKQLAEEGFEPVFQSSLSARVLPDLTDPNSFAQVRAMVSEFAELSKGFGIIHPGVTLWAERPELPAIAQEFGLMVVCPPARVLSLFANKLTFLFEAERLGIPHLVHGFDPMHTVREISNFHQRNGLSFPIILKSVKSVGSSGVFVAHDSKTLTSELPLWLDYLRRNFGEGIFFVERYLEDARHIVVPFARFQSGGFQFFPTLDASLQSRHRKLVEFCPAARLDSQIQEQLLKWTEKFASHCGFVGVGSLEFLVDGSRAFIIGGLARLTTSFALCDQVSGTQSISWQLATMQAHSAQREIPIRSPEEWSSGLSIQLYAEDSRFLLPRPGKIFELSKQRYWNFSDSTAELYMNYEEGETVPIQSTGILGLMSIMSQDREILQKRAREVLQEFWIAGSIQCNDQFLHELISHSWVNEEIFHAGFIDEDFIPMVDPSPESTQICAQVCELILSEKNQPLEEGIRWVVGEKIVKLQGQDVCQLQWISGPRYWTNENALGLSGTIESRSGGPLRICAYPLADRWMVRVGGWSTQVRKVGASQKGRERKKPRLCALATGRIHSILFREGTEVKAHEPLLLLESLGMFIPHAVPIGLKIAEWKVSAEEIVMLGQELAELDYLSSEFRV